MSSIKLLASDDDLIAETLDLSEDEDTDVEEDTVELDLTEEETEEDLVLRTVDEDVFCTDDDSCCVCCALC